MLTGKTFVTVATLAMVATGGMPAWAQVEREFINRSSP